MAQRSLPSASCETITTVSEKHQSPAELVNWPMSEKLPMTLQTRGANVGLPRFKALLQWRYLPDLARAVALAGIYVATARVGLSLGAVNGVATAVWPPTGISLAALLLY